MNREIKFRVWDGTNMLYMHQPEYRGEFYFSFKESGKISVTHYHGETEHNEHINVESLMQYIGRKDKNGVEIYCGDIVEFKADYTHNNGYKIGVFVWSEARLQYLIRVPNIDHLYNITETDEFNNKSEVLGNIHQHPELLNS